MPNSKYIRVRLTGGGPAKEMIPAPTISLIDADTGKRIPATKIHLFIQDGIVMAEVTCYLSEIDIETKAEKIVLCHRCHREQNPGLELISGEEIATASE